MSSRGLAVVLAAALALPLMGGCMGDSRDHRARPVAPAFRPAATRLVRILDAEGSGAGAFRLGSRSTTVSDARGQQLARARRLHNRIEVMDREANTALELRTEGIAEGTGGAARQTADLVGPGNVDLGQLVLDGDHLVLYGPGRARLQRGEVIVRRAHEGPVAAEVYGAPGTDLIVAVRAAGARTWEVRDEDGTLLSRVIGRNLDPLALAATALPTPLAGSEGEAYFRAGLLSFLAAARGRTAHGAEL